MTPNVLLCGGPARWPAQVRRSRRVRTSKMLGVVTASGVELGKVRLPTKTYEEGYPDQDMKTPKDCKNARTGVSFFFVSGPVKVNNQAPHEESTEDIGYGMSLERIFVSLQCEDHQYSDQDSEKCMNRHSTPNVRNDAHERAPAALAKCRCRLRC